MRRLMRLNPGLPVHEVRHGEIDPDQLFDVAAKALERIAGFEEDRHEHGADHGADYGPGNDHHHHDDDMDANRHGNIRAYTIEEETPLPWDRLRVWLETVFSLRGAEFLRLKGIVQIADEERPVVIQAVGNTFSPPRSLSHWPGGVRGSRIVLITKGLDAADLRKSFDSFVIEGIVEKLQSAP